MAYKSKEARKQYHKRYYESHKDTVNPTRSALSGRFVTLRWAIEKESEDRWISWREIKDRYASEFMFDTDLATKRSLERFLDIHKGAEELGLFMRTVPFRYERMSEEKQRMLKKLLPKTKQANIKAELAILKIYIIERTAPWKLHSL
jgi:hypothetical protein